MKRKKKIPLKENPLMNFIHTITQVLLILMSAFCIYVTHVNTILTENIHKYCN